jgi:hypothetical protein
MVIRLLRSVVSVALTLAIAFVAVPLSVMGAILLGAGLTDFAHRDDALLGLFSLGIAAIFWGTLYVWLILCGLVRIQWRFSLRALIILTTAISIVLGLICYAIR